MMIKKMFISLGIICLANLTGCENATSTKSEQSQSTVNNASVSKTASQSANNPAVQPQADVKLPAGAPYYNVSTITAFEPFDFADEYGKSAGFDIDLIRAIGEKEGFGVNFTIMPWDKIFDSVTTKNYDISASAIVITPERQQLYAFSDPYIDINRALIVKSDLKSKSFEEIIKDPTATFSVIKDSAASKILLEDFKIPEDRIKAVNTQFLAVKNVINGTSTAAFEDASVLRYYGTKYDNLAVIDYKDQIQQLGFIVNKNNPELLKKVNAGLAKTKADGTYDKIYAKWFGQKQQ